MGSIYTGLKAQAGEYRHIIRSGAVRLSPCLVTSIVPPKVGVGYRASPLLTLPVDKQKGQDMKRSIQGQDSSSDFRLWSHETQQQPL